MGNPSESKRMVPKVKNALQLLVKFLFKLYSELGQRLRGRQFCYAVVLCMVAYPTNCRR